MMARAVQWLGQNDGLDCTMAREVYWLGKYDNWGIMLGRRV